MAIVAEYWTRWCQACDYFGPAGEHHCPTRPVIVRVLDPAMVVQSAQLANVGKLPAPGLPPVPLDMRPYSSREAYADEMFDLAAE